MIGTIVGMLLVNVFLLAGVATGYSFVTRRQMRLYSIVEHLAALARRNMPLHTGLRMIAKDVGGFIGARIDRAAALLEEGRPMREAMEACRHVLAPLVRNMLSVGEASGNLAGFLDELARSYRRIVDFHHRAVYFLLYPFVLSLVVFGMVQILVITVAPRFRIISSQMGLPPSDGWTALMVGSQIVLAAAAFVAGMILFGGSSVYYGRSAFRWFKPVADRAAMWTPWIRQVVIAVSLRQFTLTLGLMLRRGATLVEAARAAVDIEMNSLMRRRLEPIPRALEEGARLSEACAKAGVPADIAWFAEAGEASGDLGAALLQASMFYETRVVYTGHIGTRMVVPVFVVLNGAVLVALWMQVFTPILGALRRVIEHGS